MQWVNKMHLKWTPKMSLLNYFNSVWHRIVLTLHTSIFLTWHSKLFSLQAECLSVKHQVERLQSPHHCFIHFVLCCDTYIAIHTHKHTERTCQRHSTESKHVHYLCWSGRMKITDLCSRWFLTFLWVFMCTLWLFMSVLLPPCGYQSV